MVTGYGNLSLYILVNANIYFGGNVIYGVIRQQQ